MRRKAKLNRITSKSSEKLRGRIFGSSELKTIRELTGKYFENGRTTISQEVCKTLDWRQPNGWLKDRACRDVLRKLEQQRYIKLPPQKVLRVTSKHENNKAHSYIDQIDRLPISTLDFSTIKLKPVKGTADEGFWNWIVNEYHYLGFKTFVGRSLKYLIYSNEKLLGAIGFCDSAWSLMPRDMVFAKLGIPKSEVRNLGVNNGRFLILPWVNVKNLASYVLSVSAKKVAIDWSDYYSIMPLYLETFVNSKKFLGTCYKAANWIYLGKTKGFKKSGSIYENSQTPKFIYIFPLKGLKRKELIQGLREANAIFD